LRENFPAVKADSEALHPFLKKLSAEVDVYRNKLVARLDEAQKLIFEEKDLCEGESQDDIFSSSHHPNLQSWTSFSSKALRSAYQQKMN
jgi:hypothetical protein